ncbi:MAG: hypothetical protein JWP45_2893 [Mucilaginibacter sp.]|nr:hypothetical protein [Mucilaginibacter sp.]
MIPVKGYAAQSAETDLAPWGFERHEMILKRLLSIIIKSHGYLKDIHGFLFKALYSLM